VSRGLPDTFAPPERSYSLYEGIDYEQYWDDPQQRRQDALEQRIVSDMLPWSGRRIIDLGCGYGRLAPCYLNRFEQVVMYDGSLSLLRQAREAFGHRAVAIAGDVAHLPFMAASFDSVLSIRVLQHIHDLRSTFQEMHRVLARDGRLVFSFHNKRNAHRIMHLIKARRIADPFSLDSAEVGPIIVSHHPNRVEALLTSAGFSAPEYQGAVVLDSLARAAERLGGHSPAGLRWAPFTGRHRLAPWLVGRATSPTGHTLQSAEHIDELLVCPSCKGDLDRPGRSYECPSCARTYPIVDGVLDFRLEGA